jgi:glycosyltransferase involved in cell wall biosynthesis
MGASHEVTLLAGWSQGKPEHEEIGGVKTYRLNYDGDDERLKKVIHQIPPKIRRLFIKAFLVWRWFVHLSAYEHFIYREALKHPADVYHAHDLPMLKPAYFAARAAKAKLVYDAHELYWSQVSLTKRQQDRLASIEEKFVNHADVVITVNEFLARIMAQRYGTKEPYVIYNCTDPPPGFDRRTEYDLIRKKMDIASDRKIILYQGWIAEHRGLENLVTSTQYMPANCILVMIGYGYYLDRLKEMVNKNNLEDKVIFMGEIPNNQIIFHSASADIGVIPYLELDLNTRYSSPNKLFEYIIAGIPILANDLIFLRRMIVHHGLGMVANFTNPEAIGAAVALMIGDESRLNSFRRNALKASETFNWETESRKLVEIYDRLQG